MARIVRVFPALGLMAGGRVVRPYGILRNVVVGDGCGRSRGAGSWHYNIPILGINEATNY